MEFPKKIPVLLFVNASDVASRDMLLDRVKVLLNLFAKKDL